jgi:hypothetical protein
VNAVGGREVGPAFLLVDTVRLGDDEVNAVGGREVDPVFPLVDVEEFGRQ